MNDETRRQRESAVLQALIDSAMGAEPGSMLDPAAMPQAEELRPLASAFCAMLDAYNRFPVFIVMDFGKEPASRAGSDEEPPPCFGDKKTREAQPQCLRCEWDTMCKAKYSRLNGTAQEAAACDHRWVWHKGEGQWDCAVCGAFGGRDHRRPDTLE